jgi:nitric oxide reductase large subunit
VVVLVLKLAFFGKLGINRRIQFGGWASEMSPLVHLQERLRQTWWLRHDLGGPDSISADCDKQGQPIRPFG